MSASNCRSYPTSRKKQPFDKSDAADLRARVQVQERFNRQLTQSAMYQQARTAKNNLQQSVQNEWLQMTGDLVRLSPRSLPNVNDFLAAMFGIKNWAGLGSAYSVAGNIRSAIVRSQKVAVNQVLYAGRLMAGKQLADLNDMLTRALPRNISNAERGEVMYDLLTVGMIPKRRSLQSQFRTAQRIPQTATDIAANRAFTQFEQRMAGYGIDGRNLDNMLNVARNVSNAFEHMAIAARAQGIEIGRIDDLGYLPAVLTDDAKLRVKAASPSALIDTNVTSGVNLGTLHNTSRSTFKYVVEDSQFAARLLGITETDLNDLLLDPLEWITFLRNNVTEAQLDTLVDSGVFGKLPMSSREVFDYMRSQYRLPYDELNELYITDINLLMSRYSESLMRSVSSTSLINTLLTQKSADFGWTVSRETQQSSADFANFVPISDSFSALAKANNMPVQQLAANIGIDPALLERLSNTYVHPQVATQWRAIFAVSVNPTAMASFGSAMLSFGRMVNKMVLTNVQFVARQVYSNVRVNAAAGGSTFTLPHAADQVHRVLNDGIQPGIFSDERVFLRDGREISERQLFEYFIKEEGASSVPGMVSDYVVARPADINKFDLLIPNNVRRLFTNRRSVARAFSNMMDYAMAHGDVLTGRKVSMTERVGRLSEAAVTSFRSMVDANYTPYATYAIAAETAAKWNVYRTVTAKVSPQHDTLDSVQQLVSGGQITRYTNSEEVRRHLAEYFVDPFDTGRVTSFVNHYVRPFAVYAMANPPMQLRHAMRHPHLYLAGNRLHTIMNAPLTDDDKNNQYTIPGWIQEGKPWFVGRASNNDPIVLMPGNFDGGTDAFVFINETTQDIQRLFYGGNNVGTLEERLASQRGEGTADYIAEMASNLHTPWKVLLEQITGREYFSGRRVELGELDAQRTLNGVRMNSRVAHLLENVLPAVRALDALNPFGAFGTAPEKDAYGNLVNPGRLSVFNTERSRTDQFAQDTTTSNAAMRLVRLAGINVRQLDYARTFYRSIADMERTATEINADLTRTKKALQAEAAGLEGVVDREEFRRRVRAYGETSQVLTRLYIDISRVTLWGEQRGLPRAETLEQLQNLRINLQSLPVPELESAAAKMALERLESDALFVEELLAR